VKGGNSLSIEIKELYDKIYRYCYFKTNDSYVAEDLTQEAFLKFFSQNTYIDKGKTLAYLYTIANHLCIDYYKKVKLQPIDEEIQGDELFENINTKITVKCAVKSLSKDMQELLLLRYVNELSMNEISKITNQSRFAIYRKINTALQCLKKMLREEDFQ